MHVTDLTHWGRVTHICINKLNIIGPDDGLSPVRRQAIIWTNAGILLIGTLGTNFSEILTEIHTFSFKKMHLKTSSVKWQPYCVSLNVLSSWTLLVKLQWSECHRKPFMIVNIGSGNGLVPSGNKPLPEPMLTQTYVIIRPQWVNDNNK